VTKPGQDVNGIARTEADHHMKCPACGQWFDMRDLRHVAEHVHDDSEIEVSGRRREMGRCSSQQDQSRDVARARAKMAKRPW